MTNMARLIVGCGYLGRRVAALWQAQGQVVHALTRGRANELRAFGVNPIEGDVRRLLGLVDLPPVETVLYAVAPDRSSGETPEDVWLTGLVNLTGVMQQWPERPRFLFISSTSVYGQSGGEFVDEGAPTHPRDATGRTLLCAEQALRRELWLDAIILRFAGLYGPGRLLRSECLRRGEPVAADADGWLNLIHVDDGAAAVIAADERAGPGTTYLVADDRPVRRREFYARLAELLAAPAPQFVPPVSTDAVNRRVSNRRLRAELRFAPRYPSFQEGLRASL
jgi:nucleoside-diphosphate-sugar epimerase